MNDRAGAKRRVADFYDRVASSYGQVGPRVFERLGERLVELVGISPGAQVLDIATGRGASLFPTSQVISPQGSAIGIDLAFAMLSEKWHAIYILGQKSDSASSSNSYSQ